MADNDSVILREAGACVSAIDLRYRAADINGKVALKPERDRAFETYSRARLNLLADGVLASATDVEDMAAIRRAIDEAADTQQLLIAAGRLVGFLARFVA